MDRAYELAVRAIRNNPRKYQMLVHFFEEDRTAKMINAYGNSSVELANHCIEYALSKLITDGVGIPGFVVDDHQIRPIEVVE